MPIFIVSLFLDIARIRVDYPGVGFTLLSAFI